MSRGWPLVWRKTAQEETSAWKSEANRLRVRAEKAERTAKSAMANQRTIAELYTDLHDSYVLTQRRNEALADSLAAARAQGRPPFDPGLARAAADRIAELARGAARGHAEATAAGMEVDA